jgi:protein-L-isoaspartate(D-aspartate) O-methyltransferase
LGQIWRFAVLDAVRQISRTKCGAARAHLTGANGYVATVELEPDLAGAAMHVLASVTDPRPDVVIGDGRHGYPSQAPYDRVIVTTGAAEIAPVWSEQLADSGRLVVPVGDDRGLGLIVVFDKIEGALVRCSETTCGFLLIRSAPSG